MAINQIPMTICGNITADLAPRTTRTGQTVISFDVASTERIERDNKWEDGQTTFIRCVAWGALAEHMTASHMGKGTRIIATGTFAQRDWQTQDGQRRRTFELTITEIGASLAHAAVDIHRIDRADGFTARTNRPTATSQANDLTDDDPWKTARPQPDGSGYADGYAGTPQQPTL